MLALAIQLVRHNESTRWHSMKQVCVPSEVKSSPHYLGIGPILANKLPVTRILQILPSPVYGESHLQMKDPIVFVHEASVLWQS